MWLLMRQFPLKHKECPLKRQLIGRVVRSLDIQVAKATNRQKNGSAEESIQNHKLNLYSENRTEISHWNRFMAFLKKALFSWNKCLKMLLSAF